MAQRRLVLIIASLTALAALPVSTADAKPPSTFNPVVEAQNFSITQQRQTIYDTPAYQQQLAVDSATQHRAGDVAPQADDPGRFFTDDLCWNLGNGCAGDIRLNNWGANGYGLVRPVLFTARDGATLSGHVWATVAGPAKRPGDRDHQRLGAGRRADVLVRRAGARQGRLRRADLRPAGPGAERHVRRRRPTQSEGVPAQTDGRPFYDGTEDAIDFLLSTPQHPYEPVPSCSNGHSHAAKQNARVKRGARRRLQPVLAAAQPDRDRARRSLLRRRRRLLHRASGTRASRRSSPGTTSAARARRRARCRASRAARRRSARQGCPADPADRTVVPITKPGARHVGRLRAAADAEHVAARPAGPSRRSRWPTAKAGVDTGEIIIRGGSHLDFSFIPNQAFGASLRGPDMIDWYTTRVVRQVPQARCDRRQAPAHPALAQRPRRGSDRPQPRRQRVLLLLPLAAGHPPGRRRDVRLRGPARGLPGDGRQRRLPRGLLLRRRSIATPDAVR